MLQNLYIYVKTKKLLHIINIVLRINNTIIVQIIERYLLLILQQCIHISTTTAWQLITTDRDNECRSLKYIEKSVDY